MFTKSLELSIFLIKKEAKFENSNPDSVGVNFLKNEIAGFEIRNLWYFADLRHSHAESLSCRDDFESSL